MQKINNKSYFILFLIDFNLFINKYLYLIFKKFLLKFFYIFFLFLL